VDDAAALYREAARRTLMQLGGSDAVLDESLTKLLLHRDGSLGDCERLIAEMDERRDRVGLKIQKFADARANGRTDAARPIWIFDGMDRQTRQIGEHRRSVVPDDDDNRIALRLNRDARGPA